MSSQDKNQFPKIFDDSFYDMLKAFDSYVDQSIKHIQDFFNQPTIDVDMYDTADEVIVEAHLPGYSRDQVRVEVFGNRLKISAENSVLNEMRDDEGQKYHKEQSLQKVERSIHLPFPIRQEEVKGSFHNEMLRLVIPRKGVNQGFIDIE